MASGSLCLHLSYSRRARVQSLSVGDLSEGQLSSRCSPGTSEASVDPGVAAGRVGPALLSLSLLRPPPACPPCGRPCAQGWWTELLSAQGLRLSGVKLGSDSVVPVSVAWATARGHCPVRASLCLRVRSSRKPAHPRSFRVPGTVAFSSPLVSRGPPSSCCVRPCTGFPVSSLPSSVRYVLQTGGGESGRTWLPAPAPRL